VAISVEELATRLNVEAARLGITPEELLDELTARLPTRTAPAGHRLSFIGIGASGDTRPFDIHRERAELAERKLAEGI
jgi:hypothetical protein